jgi:hypothetical protein
MMVTPSESAFLTRSQLRPNSTARALIDAGIFKRHPMKSWTKRSDGIEIAACGNFHCVQGFMLPEDRGNVASEVR